MESTLPLLQVFSRFYKVKEIRLIEVFILNYSTCTGNDEYEAQKGNQVDLKNINEFVLALMYFFEVNVSIINHFHDSS